MILSSSSMMTSELLSKGLSATMLIIYAARLLRMQSTITDNRLDDFRRNYADSIVTRMYLGGDSADDIRFQCGYYLDRSSSALMLRYLKYHDATVEEAATGYWQTHQDDMLLELRKNEILREKLRVLEAREKLRVLEANPNHPLHKQKAVMDAVKDSGAKTVYVTIIKGGEEYSFKYSADRLSRYMEGKYSARLLRALRQIQRLHSRRYHRDLLPGKNAL